ncbi:MAG: winged helix-turn-helix domain-containing protein, partial [Pseudomonadales bacterium]
VLLAQQGNIVSKEDLTQLALNREYTRYDRSVDVHISSIRKKLAQFLPDVELIKTVRGSGYIFINEADA